MTLALITIVVFLLTVLLMPKHLTLIEYYTATLGTFFSADINRLCFGISSSLVRLFFKSTRSESSAGLPIHLSATEYDFPEFFPL